MTPILHPTIGQAFLICLCCFVAGTIVASLMCSELKKAKRDEEERH